MKVEEDGSQRGGREWQTGLGVAQSPNEPPDVAVVCWWRLFALLMASPDVLLRATLAQSHACPVTHRYTQRVRTHTTLPSATPAIP